MTAAPWDVAVVVRIEIGLTILGDDAAEMACLTLRDPVTGREAGILMPLDETGAVPYDLGAVIPIRVPRP